MLLLVRDEEEGATDFFHLFSQNLNHHPKPSSLQASPTTTTTTTTDNNAHDRVLRPHRVGQRPGRSRLGDGGGGQRAAGRGVARGARGRRSGLELIFVELVFFSFLFFFYERRPRRPEAALHLYNERRPRGVDERSERVPRRLCCGGSARELEGLESEFLLFH